MSSQAIAIRLSTPTRTSEPGRGFYQLEEDALYVQIGTAPASGTFFSYLESPQVRLDCDRTGRLCFIEVAVPRRQWPVVDPLIMTNGREACDLRILDFRRAITPPQLVTNRRRDSLILRFAEGETARSCRIGEFVTAEVGFDNTLRAISIVQIVDDLAGQEIAAYRRAHRESNGSE